MLFHLETEMCLEVRQEGIQEITLMERKQQVPVNYKHALVHFLPEMEGWLIMMNTMQYFTETSHNANT